MKINLYYLNINKNQEIFKLFYNKYNQEIIKSVDLFNKKVIQ